jgi:hypothetical protein
VRRREAASTKTPQHATAAKKQRTRLECAAFLLAARPNTPYDLKNLSYLNEPSYYFLLTT